MESFKLTKQKFKELYDNIITNFEKELLNKGEVLLGKPSYQYYGYGSVNENLPSLSRSMGNKENVRQFLDEENILIQGRYLYDRYAQYLKKNRTYVVLSRVYLNIFLKYIDAEDQLGYYTTAGIREEDKKYKNFHGWYYSYQSHEVKEFSLELEHTKDGSIVGASQIGFHEGRRVEPFIGEANRVNNLLYINLVNEKGDEMKIMARVFGMNPEDWSYLSCTVATVSSEEFPLCARAVLIQKDKEGIIESLKEKKFIIERFLMLKRNTFRASPRLLELKELQTRGASVNSLESMIGLWRVWRYGEKKVIIQSKLEIEPNYKTTLYSPLYKTRNLKTQTCVLSVSTETYPKLCISTHPEKGRSVLAYGIINIPIIEATDILVGAYANITSDIADDINPKGGIMVLKKEPKDANFEVRKIENVEVFLTENDCCKDIADKLATLNKLRELEDV